MRGSSSVVAGGSLSVAWQIRNNGTGTAATSYSQVRITNSSTSWGSPTNNVGSAQATGSIAEGSTIVQSTTVTVPSTVGTYYVWVIADNTKVLPQSNTSNDYAVSASFTVTAEIPGAFTLSNDPPYWDPQDPAGPAVQLWWKASSNATRYEVYRNGSKIFPPANETLTGTAFLSLLGMSAGEKYDFYVIAYNSAGSRQSNTISVGPMPGAPSTLSVNGIQSSYSTATVPYKPSINLTGKGFTLITEIRWNCTMPNGTACLDSPYTWTSANWGSKFTRSSDTVASVTPTLVGTNDPAGTYNWSVTFSGNGQSVSKSFSVIYDPLETTVDVQPVNVKRTKSSVTAGSMLGVAWDIRNNGTVTANSSNSQVRITSSNAANGY